MALKNNNPLTTPFSNEKPIIGMIHLRGADEHSKLQIAMNEVRQLESAGLDGLLVENYFGGVPVAEAVLSQLQATPPGIPYGVNILDDFELTFALARRYGATFVQLDSVAGHLKPDDDKAFGHRIQDLRADSLAYVFGGVRFKYQPYLSDRTLADDLRIAEDRCDAVVVTGTGTGMLTPMDKVMDFRALLSPAFPLFVGAGVTAENIVEHLQAADGAIVGSYFKTGHVADAELDPRHVREIMIAVERLRSARQVESVTQEVGQ